MLLAALGAIFLKGFEEAIGIAVFIVGVYLLMNLIVVGVGFYEMAVHPQSVVRWQDALFANYGNPLLMLGVSLLVFLRPRWGSLVSRPVYMMPLVRGDEGTIPSVQGPHPQHAQNAHGSRPDHELLPPNHEPRDDAAHPRSGARTGRQRQRPGARLRGAQLPR